jgi:hypothetical protein
MDWLLHPVSIRQGWLHVKELFSRNPVVSNRIKAAFLPEVDEVDIQEKTKEALKDRPVGAGQQANLLGTGSPQRRFSSVWVG